MNQEEMDKIVEAVIEKILLKMPDVVGNLMSQHAAFNEAKDSFFKKYPEFVQNKEIVAKTIEFEEGKEIGRSYEEVLESAVPDIRKNLSLTKNLTFDSIQAPTDLSIQSSGDNGAI